MQLLAISISPIKTLAFQGRKVSTGINKTPVDDPVKVTIQGIEGDRQADRKNHGGVDKAVYAYAVENYRFWESELGKTLDYGRLGENLAILGLTDPWVHIGDIFRIGNVELQVTQPRVPCFKLGMRMEDASFVERFHHSGRVGFYFRVLREGTLQAGDGVERLHTDAEGLTIAEAMLALHKNPRQQDIIARALNIPALSQAWRDSLTKKQKK